MQRVIKRSNARYNWTVLSISYLYSEAPRPYWRSSKYSTHQTVRRCHEGPCCLQQPCYTRSTPHEEIPDTCSRGKVPGTRQAWHRPKDDHWDLAEGSWASCRRTGRRVPRPGRSSRRDPSPWCRTRIPATDVDDCPSESRSWRPEGWQSSSAVCDAWLLGIWRPPAAELRRSRRQWSQPCKSDRPA